MHLRFHIFMLFASALTCFGLFGQAKEFAHPAIISFETGVFPAATSGKSELNTSGDHFKHGQKSLQWKWSETDATLSFVQNIPYAAQNPHGDNSVATFVFWLYSLRQLPEAKLIFEFLKDDKVCSSFEYGLNFKGWSGAWVAFDRDMQGKPQPGMNELRITVKGAAQGELFFDHLMLSSFQDVRHHTAGLEAPFINANTDSHWLTLLNSWNKKFDLSIKKEISAEDMASLQTIEKRFVETLTENKKAISVKALTASFNQYRIRKNRDGSVRGLPVFFERWGETYERLGAQRYNLLFDNPSGLSEFNELLFNLANTYHQSASESEKQTLAGMYLLLIRHSLDQGFRAGSAMGTLHHLGYSMRNFYASGVLMRSELQKAGLAGDMQQAMEWFAGTGEIKTAPLVAGMDVDAFNTSLSGRLASILMLDDSSEKVRYMNAFVRWVNNGLMISDGTQGTFKIDGSMHHHRHNYPAYAVGGLDGAVNAAWILHNTGFALSQEGRENLKNSLLAMRFYSNLLTWPLSLSGRHPDGLGHIDPLHFARLAMAGSPDGQKPVDTELASAYLRLVGNQPTNYTRIFQKSGIKAEKAPEGNQTFPYSCLNVHRRDNWLVSAMGHSRYFWATESYVGANHYGRYLNHGHLQIMANGQPVSNFSSGFNQKGWDWNHFPGTTATYLPLKDLKADIKNLDENSGYEEMLLSDETFAGGISIRNRNGAFAMKLHEHDKYNGSLRARKSFFFFDNRIVALGSNIRSVLPDKEVHTTLFQVYQSEAVKVPLANNNPVTSMPFSETFKGKMNHLSDGLNNHFFVREGEVVLQKKVQESFHEETDAPTRNPFASAWINHGAKAKTDHYEYLILVQPDNKTVETTLKNLKSVKKSPYEVLQKDSMAHIVHDKLSNTTAFAFFEAGEFKNKNLFVSVNVPALFMMEKISENQINISLADPDLRFYEGAADEAYDASGKRIERSVYSRQWINNPSGKSEIELVLSGEWKTEGNSENIQVKSVANGKTTFRVSCQHGLSRETSLVKIR